MTLWQRFYKAIGGLGPDDDDPKEFPSWWALPGRMDSRIPAFHGPSELARLLMWLGFLARDPNRIETEASYYYNMKWQWQFWKGPYYEYVVQNRDRPGHNIKMRWTRSRAPWEPL